MENMIKTFVNEKFGTVRTLIKDGQPWFVGKDMERDELIRAIEIKYPQKLVFIPMEEEYTEEVFPEETPHKPMNVKTGGR